jgi:hypothetical protein
VLDSQPCREKEWIDAAARTVRGRVAFRRSVRMAGYLRVVPLLVEDPASLGDLERIVVETLEPPLNFEHV